MTGSLWFSVVFAFTMGLMCGVLIHWPRKHRPGDGPLVQPGPGGGFARSVYDQPPEPVVCDCSTPPKTAGPSIVHGVQTDDLGSDSTATATHQLCYVVSCPECGGEHLDSEDCACSRRCMKEQSSES